MNPPVSACRCSHLRKALITPLQAVRLASSIRSRSLSSPALRLNQVYHSALFVTPHVLTHLVQIYRAFSQNSATKMPPIDKPVPGEKYDIVFIGGGSGGSAGSVCFTRLYSRSGTNYVMRHAQRRASLYGAKTALIEESGRLGGTCVNVGGYLSSGGLRTLTCASPRLRAEKGE
jgi:hypothetical protein